MTLDEFLKSALPDEKNTLEYQTGDDYPFGWNAYRNLVRERLKQLYAEGKFSFLGELEQDDVKQVCMKYGAFWTIDKNDVGRELLVIPIGNFEMLSKAIVSRFGALQNAVEVPSIPEIVEILKTHGGDKLDDWLLEAFAAAIVRRMKKID